MIEKSEFNYRKLIENELDDLNIHGETRSKLLAESDDILRLALESKDQVDFFAHLAKRDPTAKLIDFKYDHVIDYLIKRSHVSKKSAMADFRSRISKAVEESSTLETRNTTHGSMMAIQADALHGKPVFTIHNITTDVAANSEQAESWTEEQIGSGYQLVFILSKEGWKLLAADSGLEYSEDQVKSFFSNDLLNHLWLSHQPFINSRRRDFNAQKAKGLN